MRNARTVIAGVLCALMICCMLGNAYTVKGKEMLLAPENKETKDQNTENSKIEDNNTENEEELNKGAKKEDTSMQIGAPSALLMEASTGTVLFEQDADTKRPPASVTKIMTMLLIFDAVESKKISLEDKVPVSEFAASMGGSQVFLETGETQTVDTMLKCISIASANDACVAMAEYISGSEEAFVQEMNKRAKALGMHNTNFVNCNGLDAQGHVTTARDIALMSRELITKYPQIHNYSTIWMENITHVTKQGSREFGLSNTNRLLKMATNYRVTGLKTGSTSMAKYCLSATAEKDGVRLIAVIMAAPDYKARFADAQILLNYGYANCNLYKDENVLDTRSVSIENGISDELAIDSASDFSSVLLRGEKADDVKKILVQDEPLTAPIKKGYVVGHIEYSINGRILGSVEVVAAENIKKMTFGYSFKKVLYLAFRS